MRTYQYLACEKCKHYESFHQFPNPNAYARHFCKKCDEEIRYVKAGYFSDFYVVWLPKQCYFNNYFEESEQARRERKRSEKCIIEMYQQVE